MDNRIDQLLEKVDRVEALLHSHKRVLNLTEFANYAGLSKSYVYKLTSQGKVPFYKPNGKHIFDREEVETWLLQNRNTTQAEIEAEAATYVTLEKAKVR